MIASIDEHVSPDSAVQTVQSSRAVIQCCHTGQSYRAVIQGSPTEQSCMALCSAVIYGSLAVLQSSRAILQRRRAGQLCNAVRQVSLAGQSVKQGSQTGQSGRIIASK